jgi:PglZ domain
VPALTDALTQHVAERLGRRPLLVWYDPTQSLAMLAESAVPDNASFLSYGGSFLALRTEFELADPELERRWVIYVGAERPAISWLRDLELAGSSEMLGLRQLASRAFGISVASPLRRGLDGPGAPLLAARWDELVGHSPGPADVEQGLLAAALSLPTSNPRDLVLAIVGSDQAFATLAQAGLQPLLRSVLARHGLDVRKRELQPAQVAAALLLSEAVTVGGLDESALQATLPEPARRSQWAAWARDWIHGPATDAFRHWSSEIERTYSVAEHLDGLASAKVESFASVDDVLLEQVERRLRVGDRSDLIALAERRANTYWARQAEQAGDPLFWKPLHAALELLERSEPVTHELAATSTWTLEGLLDTYADSWWHLDDAYRRLEATWSRLPDTLRAVSALPACRAYAAFLDAVGQAAAEAASKGWEAAGWMDHGSVVRQIGTGAKVALMLADALRFDLAQLLAQRLGERGITVEATRTLAAIPSVTQVGMASILSGGELQELVRDGVRVVPAVGGSLVRNRADRLERLRHRFGRVEDVELAEIAAGRIPANGALLVVYARAIDEQGDSLPQVGLDLFERLVGEIARAVEKLLDAGYQRVVVAADHGFVLAPRDVEIRRIPLSRGDHELVRATRYAIGRPPEVEGTVRLALPALGWDGDKVALFPRGLAVFALPGETPRFFHGGLMPQEVGLLTLACTRPAPLGAAVRVHLAGHHPIDTLLPRFVLAADPAEELLARPRVVRVLVKLEGSVIGESDPVHVAPGGTAEATARLARYGDRVQVIVEDVETQEVLEEATIAVTLPPGYDDLGI